MTHIEGWRKWSAYLLTVALISGIEVGWKPLSAGSLNTIENLALMYIGIQGGIDFANKWRKKGGE